MCHKARKMGTMVEAIQHVSPAMVKILANTGNALTLGRLPLVSDMKPPLCAGAGVFHPKEETKEYLRVKKLRMAIFHPKFLHSNCIRTPPHNLDMC